MRISDLKIKTLGLAALSALAACAGTGGPAPKAVNVTVGGAPIVLAAAGSLCVDPASLRRNSAGTFALLDDCIALGPVTDKRVAPANNGLITVSISPGPISRPGEESERGLGSLREFLAGPGLPALARSAERDGVKIVSSKIEDDMLILQVRDNGPAPLPKLSKTFWRGYTEVKGQTVSASLSTFVARGAQSKGRTLLKAVLEEIIDANAAPEPAEQINEEPESEEILQSTGAEPLQDPAKLKDEAES